MSQTASNIQRHVAIDDGVQAYYYQTSNLAIATYLLSYGIKIKGANSPSGSIMGCTFCFTGKKESIDELILMFSESQEKRFDDNMRYLKSLAVKKGGYDA